MTWKWAANVAGRHLIDCVTLLAAWRRPGGRPAPPWLGRDGSQWTTGDQVAWGEQDPGSVLAAAPAPLAGQLRSLLAALRPVRLPAQLIHGDLGGNVLFAPGQPPAVIDFSPYWRPAGLALAVAAVDALTWSGADPAILDKLAHQPDLDQLETLVGLLGGTLAAALASSHDHPGPPPA